MWRQRLCYIYCIPQIVKWNICNEVFGSPFTCEKCTGVTFCWIPSTCGLAFNGRADRTAKWGAINNMQSTKLDVPLSSKEMCNIIENDTWNRLGFSRSISYCPVLNNSTRSVSSLVYNLLSTLSKQQFRKMLCAFVRRKWQYLICYSVFIICSPICLQNGRLLDMFIYLYEIFC